MSSTQATIALPTQAVFSHVRAVSSSTRALVSISTRSARNSCRDDERQLPTKRFRSGEELLSTRVKISSTHGLAPPPV